MILEIIDDSNYLNSLQVQMIEEIIQLAALKLAFDFEFELDVSIVDNETIRTLNRDYRSKDDATDVLSFALTEGEDEVDWAQTLDEDTPLSAVHLGDIIISYEKAKEQAEDYGHSFERELAFLAVHGFLHLNGYDHQSADEAEEMFSIQEEVLNEYGLTR
ncbi:rRNA maturation RNase YbeY [Facklamia sp. DSM 111018]|uniref:Endoribonuclease YbeY n=1 Tax=Facklamia lactis TaxID=2749967 RepID=A0ABS0LP41_9LACT|nr:rRNA maturation RNase YbeY [Facklamia lactis]MBG9980102.1 rRNA maturation RNase YbeY [Facklamia lactis]MBG9985904.1 rRNA maturation RNase YbeY [Facklamia lactis]